MHRTLQALYTHLTLNNKRVYLEVTKKDKATMQEELARVKARSVSLTKQREQSFTKSKSGARELCSATFGAASSVRTGFRRFRFTFRGLSPQGLSARRFTSASWCFTSTTHLVWKQTHSRGFGFNWTCCANSTVWRALEHRVSETFPTSKFLPPVSREAKAHPIEEAKDDDQGQYDDQDPYDDVSVLSTQK